MTRRMLALLFVLAASTIARAAEPETVMITLHPKAGAEQALAGKNGENRGNDAKARKDGNVHFGVPEEPKQVLPQKRGTTGLRQHLIIHHETHGIEETRSRCPIEEQQRASWQ